MSYQAVVSSVDRTRFSSRYLDQGAKSSRRCRVQAACQRSGQGKWPALKLLVDILQDIERRAEPQTEESSFGLADKKVIEQLKARFSKPQK